MYQTRRSERNLTGPLRAPKAERGQYIQTIINKSTGELKHIIHERATKDQISMLKFIGRHNIGFGLRVMNGFKVPKNKMMLKVEGEKIRLKQSNLSSSERVKVLEALEK